MPSIKMSITVLSSCLQIFSVYACHINVFYKPFHLSTYLFGWWLPFKKSTTDLSSCLHLCSVCLTYKKSSTDQSSCLHIFSLFLPYIYKSTSDRSSYLRIMSVYACHIKSLLQTNILSIFVSLADFLPVHLSVYNTEVYAAPVISVI
jgi:hypothetical protein